MNDETVDKMISMGELIKRLGLSRSTINKMMKDETFPVPIKIGERRIAWKVAAIDEWLEGREALS